MKRFLLGLALLSSAACHVGCASDPASPYIPWWKGIPASVLSPDSQEAYGWHRQHHEGGQPN